MQIKDEEGGNWQAERGGIAGKKLDHAGAGKRHTGGVLNYFEQNLGYIDIEPGGKSLMRHQTNTETEKMRQAKRKKKPNTHREFFGRDAKRSLHLIQRSWRLPDWQRKATSSSMGGKVPEGSRWGLWRVGS